jgi:hypothetical protein
MDNPSNGSSLDTRAAHSQLGGERIRYLLYEEFFPSSLSKATRSLMNGRVVTIGENEPLLAGRLCFVNLPAGIKLAGV